jgi:hypothetical protein
MDSLLDTYGLVCCALIAFSMIALLASAFLPSESRKKLLQQLLRKWNA